MALVTPAAFTVAFPPEPRADTGWAGLTVTNRFAGYFWHITMWTGQEWLAAGLEVAPNSDLQLPPFPNLAAVVAAGRVRWCRVDGHIISCAGPIHATAWTEGKRVIISITERGWLQLLHHQRPASVHLSRGQENTKYGWVDSVAVAYR